MRTGRGGGEWEEEGTLSLLKHTLHGARAARASHCNVEFVMVRRGGVGHRFVE